MKTFPKPVNKKRKSSKAILAVRAAVAVAVGTGLLTFVPQAAVWAQTLPDPASDSAAAAREPAAPPTEPSSSPIRMARFSYLHGSVTWRSSAKPSVADAPNDAPAAAADGTTKATWANAALNMPLQQGAQIWVSDNSRAELQFDDGSRLRLNANTLLTLQTLYSDAEGEFTEINLSGGEIYLRLTHKYAEYQISSSQGSVKASGPARFGVGTGDTLRVGVHVGSATLEAATGKITRLNAREFLSIAAATNAFPSVQSLPRASEWDMWNLRRDRELDGYGQSVTYQSVPPSITLWGDNLDSYGTWRSDTDYGTVWVPTVSEANWRPYYHGQWTWVEPFGWTWVGAEPWGWTPYHYGTWFHAPYGWAWRPGSVTQFWSPAVVSFYRTGSNVAWCPLAPREVRYPAALPPLGFHHGYWPSYFSIGGASAYYPGAKIGVYEPHIWQARYPNQIRIPNRNPHYRTGTASSVLPTYHQSGGNPAINRMPFVRPFAAAAPVPTNAAPMNARNGGGTVLPAAAFGQSAIAAKQTVRVLPSFHAQIGASVRPPVAAPTAPLTHPPLVQARPVPGTGEGNRFRLNEEHPAGRPNAFASPVSPVSPPIRRSGLDNYLRQRNGSTTINNANNTNRIDMGGSRTGTPPPQRTAPNVGERSGTGFGVTNSPRTYRFTEGGTSTPPNTTLSVRRSRPDENSFSRDEARESSRRRNPSPTVVGAQQASPQAGRNGGSSHSDGNNSRPAERSSTNSNTTSTTTKKEESEHSRTGSRTESERRGKR